ncbi:uncharacterized protein LOC123211563 [Mangifera indica]|uniref:uncharacterized protein LOC123211563 n=1 Tax=Mangifera indica TaxID=29780 RepID=UPI001CFA97F3|nr:uncharacterized protein LOC123211563 [Mangifera indica]
MGKPNSLCYADRFKSFNGDYAVSSEEQLLPRSPNFDILTWWKLNDPKYPTLQRIARDILAISVSTIASESAFSTTGKGTIVSLRGPSYDFDWDPIFQPNGYQQTKVNSSTLISAVLSWQFLNEADRCMQKMPKDQKNEISHRCKALAMLKAHFVKAGYTFQIDTSV